jgi:hypothetical protein
MPTRKTRKLTFKQRMTVVTAKMACVVAVIREGLQQYLSPQLAPSIFLSVMFASTFMTVIFWTSSWKSIR